jgi:hypothetical protein
MTDCLFCSIEKSRITASNELAYAIRDGVGYVEYDGLFSFTPVTPAEKHDNTVVDINKYRWKKHCRGLFQLPVAA